MALLLWLALLAGPALGWRLRDAELSLGLEGPLEQLSGFSAAARLRLESDAARDWVLLRQRRLRLRAVRAFDPNGRQAGAAGGCGAQKW